MKQLIGLTLIGILGFNSVSLAARDDQTGDCIRRGDCRDMRPVNVPECIKQRTCRDTNDQA
jgi:hypothetical protein